jgi:transposase
MTTHVDFADTQTYLQHFRNHGCDPTVIDNTEGLFNLCWFNVGLIDELKRELKRKTVNIVRLQEIIFGAGAIVETADNDGEAESASTPLSAHEQTSTEEEPPQKKRKQSAKGHGRRGVNDYPGAQDITCRHGDLKAVDACPLCQQGVMVPRPPKIRLQFDGAAPLKATRYELEQLACSRCPFVTTALPPDAVDLSQKYTPEAKATLVYLHYGMGLPYYRLAKMQKMLGVPIAASTQSELVAAMMGPVHAVFNYLVTYSAQSRCVYQDDTGVKIQALLKENKEMRPARKGMYTSGFIAEGDHKVVLYFSGRAHAGENFDSIIVHRSEDKGRVIRMADALPANSKHATPVLEGKCSSHAFRRFRSLLSIYPEEALFVMKLYGQVYDHDAYCKDQKYSDVQRLAYHQEHSRPLMQELKAWAERILSSGAEPNSPLATECQYLWNHWDGLTLFLKVPGAPLDNNALEAMLKYMITYRKNSQSFKTVYSAQYGSRLISLIVTCMVNNIDAIDYLTQLQRHEEAVWSAPEAWAPWHYQQTLEQVAKAQSRALQTA